MTAFWDASLPAALMLPAIDTPNGTAAPIEPSGLTVPDDTAEVPASIAAPIDVDGANHD
jgi:hypothetical protein